MSGENKWERRRTEEDERLSVRWREEVEGGMEDEMMGAKRGECWGGY